ncbi:MAG: hypothetical protein QXS02_03930 [Candidatus Thermoplasmatota archaeon]
MVILVTFLTLLYTVIGCLLFLDLRCIRAPDIVVDVDPVVISSDYVDLRLGVQVVNVNMFDIGVEDVNISLYSADGRLVGCLYLDGDVVPSQQRRVFTGVARVQLDDNISVLTSRVTGLVSAMFLGVIKKTIPFSVVVRVNMGGVFEGVVFPEVAVDVDASMISQDGVTVKVGVMVRNSNFFDLSIKNVTVGMLDDEGVEVKRLYLDDFVVRSHGVGVLNSTTLIPITILNSRFVTVRVSGVVGFRFMGFSMNLPFSVPSRIQIPNLKDVFPSERLTLAVIRTSMRPSLRGIISDIVLEVYNPNQLALEAKGITFSLYRVDRGGETLVGSCVVDEALVDAYSRVNISAQVLLRYSKLLMPQGKGFMPDTLLVMVSANVTFAGLDQYFWVGVSAYQSMYVFR